MHYWHEVLPRPFGLVEKFNHGYPVRHAPTHFRRTLEIGPREILEELHLRIPRIEQRSFFPIPLPIIAGNLVIGLTLRPRPQPFN